MKINFYPDHNNLELEKAAKDYFRIWKKEGNKIVKVLEDLSGLKFKEKIINAVIYADNSFSIPLSLESGVTDEKKKSILVHELCHRLFVGNNIKIKNLTNNNYHLETHKPVDLILYDALCELYGKEFAKENVDYEISLWSGKNISPYKIAWDWALKMTKGERAKEFERYFE